MLATIKPLPEFPHRRGQPTSRAQALRAVYLANLNMIDHQDNDTRRDLTHFADAMVTPDLLLDPDPVTVRTSQGYETRYERNCAACQALIGYHLDAQQFASTADEGVRTDVLYVFTGTLKTSNELEVNIDPMDKVGPIQDPRREFTPFQPH